MELSFFVLLQLLCILPAFLSGGTYNMYVVYKCYICMYNNNKPTRHSFINAIHMHLIKENQRAVAVIMRLHTTVWVVVGCMCISVVAEKSWCVYQHLCFLAKRQWVESFVCLNNPRKYKNDHKNICHRSWIDASVCLIYLNAHHRRNRKQQIQQ